MRAFRFALDPSATQVRALRSHCGAARAAFNIEATDGTLVFLWISAAHEIPGTQGLRTYAMTATQWKPTAQGGQTPR